MKYLAFLILAASLFTACKDDDSENSIVGEWNLVSDSYLRETDSPSQTFSNESTYASGVNTLTLSPDGTFNNNDSALIYRQVFNQTNSNSGLDTTLTEFENVNLLDSGSYNLTNGQLQYIFQIGPPQRVDSSFLYDYSVNSSELVLNYLLDTFYVGSTGDTLFLTEEQIIVYERN